MMSLDYFLCFGTHWFLQTIGHSYDYFIIKCYILYGSIKFMNPFLSAKHWLEALPAAFTCIIEISKNYGKAKL